MTWQKNSQQFKAVNANLKTGPGGQQFLNNKVNTTTKVNTGNTGTQRTLNNTNFKPNGQNTLNKTGNPQGIAAINQGVGNKVKTNTGNNVRLNTGNNVRLNNTQTFRPNTNFRPNVSNRVNVQNYKKK
jgi:hypothetical protein